MHHHKYSLTELEYDTVGEGYIYWIANKYLRKRKREERQQIARELKMAQKKLEQGSQYAKYDIDGDGIVTDEEFEMDAKMSKTRE